AEIADAFEGACIKAKAGASLTFCGTGSLIVNGTAKNGIKGGAESSFVFQSGTYNITASNNGIAADGSITINGGNFSIDAVNDGIKSVPDVDDTASKGQIIISGGTFDIEADGDGIQAESLLEIRNGTFRIITFGGYNTSGFDEDTMSSKGLKASGDREDIENTITITGGSFSLNCRDDAVHSDTYITVTGGTFGIYTGDDGFHADTTLTLGTEGGLARDPELTVFYSYEGLEAGTVYIYSGKHYVQSTDDGINAAGGSSSGTDLGRGGGNSFKPGGGRPGMGGGMNGGFGPQAEAGGDYNLYVYGGDVYVNCLGDGLDSNGGLYLYGGNVTVFSQGTGGDNSPLDFDGTSVINGAAVFAAGTNPMNENPTISDQAYLRQTSSLLANTAVTLKTGNNILYSAKLIRNINYLLYTSPDLTNTPSLSAGGSVDPCHSDGWAHNWDNGTVSGNTITYTCTDCGMTEQKTIVSSESSACTGHYAADAADEGYSVAFDIPENCTVNIYYTHDYSSPNEENVTQTVSRNDETGLADSTGNGQINFTVVPDSGCTITDFTVIALDGTYKNIKDISSDVGIPYSYRITKISADTTVTIHAKTTASEPADETTYYTQDRTSLSLSLSPDVLPDTAGTYTMIVGYYSSDGQMLDTEQIQASITDATYTVSDLSCPTEFAQCCVYFLNDDSQPVCEKVIVPSAS
ncbi:MAG: carbohydrate-binding domain-containing protein, partial [Eubacterium sp.]|nr:carbohydrate-binding domain-containing protein [Eubacterium sp.]